MAGRKLAQHVARRREFTRRLDAQHPLALRGASALRLLVALELVKARPSLARPSLARPSSGQPFRDWEPGVYRFVWPVDETPAVSEAISEDDDAPPPDAETPGVKSDTPLTTAPLLQAPLALADAPTPSAPITPETSQDARPAARKRRGASRIEEMTSPPRADTAPPIMTEPPHERANTEPATGAPEQVAAPTSGPLARREPANEPSADTPTSAAVGQRADIAPIDPAALFTPQDTDRSPQAWLARLQQAATQRQASDSRKQAPGRSETRAAAHSGPAPRQSPPLPAASAVSQPMPASVLSDSARRFLEPLVGVDPASVALYRGPVAADLTAAHAADAVALGEVIALGTSDEGESPETLGLVAHELTHVARRRAPRFVPPIAQAPAASHTPELFGPLATAQERERSDDFDAATDEETVARRVEARVTQAARGQHAPASPALAPVTVAAGDAGDIWGGLPAPWQPLPSWPTPLALTLPPVPVPFTGSPFTRPDSPAIASSAPTTASAPSVANAAPDAAQRAETGRDLPVEAAAPPQLAQPHASAPEPDLDALALQVHAILKRRLAVERRREG